MVIVDGVPYIFFVPSMRIERLKRFIRKIISMFPDNLVLGISDDLPLPFDEKRLPLTFFSSLCTLCLLISQTKCSNINA